MSVQLHCDNCDESLGRVSHDPTFRREFHTEDEVLRAQIGSTNPVLAVEHTYFCDWLCLAKWAKRKASDE